MKQSLLVAWGLSVLAAGGVTAQDVSKAPSPQQKDGSVYVEETLVVTGSKSVTELVNSPSTITVVTADELATAPTQNLGDVIRSAVPGVNVIQMSARDFNLTSRQNTSVLTNSTLVLLDGRPLYLDFLGLVLWDFVPQSMSEIKQVEMVRGPASAIWGANAMTGVVNIISKTPREAEGFALNLNAGLFDRSAGSRADDGSGRTYGGNFSYAKAPSSKLSYRISAGYFDSSPLSRPTGIVGGCAAGVKCVPHPLDSTILTGGAVYPADSPSSFPNTGTSQPKADLRVDQELSGGARLTYQGGYAGTRGIIHSAIGPFDIQSGSYLAYGKLAYSKNRLKVNLFGNFTDAIAPSLLNIDADTLQPVQLAFKTQTYDFEVGNSNLVGRKHILTYGANARRNNFDITLTPNSQDRNEFGAYFQEEFFIAKFRLSAGLRVDKFGNLPDPVLSPRVTLMVKPAPSHSIRLSFNRAFRSPSVVNNYQDQDIFNSRVIDLRPLQPLLPPPLKPSVASPFRLRVNTFGNVNLKEESLSAYEIAYTGTVRGKTTLGLAVYRNDSNDNINFTYLNELSPELGIANGLTFYSPTDPARVITVNPDGSLAQPLTLPPTLMAILAGVPPALGGPIVFPHKVATYLNLGPLRNEGLEASIEHSFTRGVSAFANYSYQKAPQVLEPDPGELRYPTSELGVPAKNRFNAGVSFNTARYLGSASVNYAGKAFWVDVLDSPYFGYTDSYAMVNASFGMKFGDGKVIACLKGTNLTNETIQQHVYGDLLKISVVAEVRIFVK